MISRTRRRVLTAAVTGIALLASDQVVPQIHAECVKTPPVCDSLAKASIVVLADVIEASSSIEVVGGAVRHVPQIVRLRVVERFKGIPEDQREITAAIATGGFDDPSEGLKLGRHLIFAFVAEKGGLWRIACSRTKAVSENDETGEVRQARQCAARIQRRHPAIQLTLLTSSTGNILKQLRDRTADAGFVFGEVQDSDIGSQYLTDVSLVVVAPLAANAQLQSGTWTAVASLPWIASTIDCPFEAIGSAIFTSMGHTPPKVVVADDGAIKIDLIRAGVGAALMEQSEGEEAAASGGVALWNPDGIRCPLSFAWLKQREKEPLLDAMRTAVEQIWQTSES